MIKVKMEEEKALLYTPYNAEFVKKIKKIGGARWDAEKKGWSIPANMVDAAREIMMDVYGETDQPDDASKHTLRVTFNEERSECCGAVMLYGKTLASAYGRDSGARVGEDVALISGKIGSGGSVKNWRSVIDAGSVFILYNVPENKMNEELPENVEMEIIDNPHDQWTSLLAEREKIAARLAEINRQLAEMAEGDEQRLRILAEKVKGE